ncbi:MAG: hypothetical protein A2X61_16780 [Ignavibacteria bacterium GWB2_35_12]|nr:MAG: hypothetical protein A2X63_04865 [Ignavibacteria bacterium GWA2_35_8]OGU38010.1 MAG: hypothetical protein A2X61_16780 [Ignavibacteria bacterium GWB2_35_12]OGV25068.1 MAG: hypothetical protein A2475_16845 [Ignavibacteria bacterium RIFOXYC2_FULL_35_21]
MKYLKEFIALTSFIVLAAVILTASTSCSQFGFGNTGHSGHSGHSGHMGNMGNMGQNDENHDHSQPNEEIKKSDLIREGIVDLVALDENKDGKVFQDQMHWNVISDKTDSCPICFMKLTEVKLSDARTNLINNGYYVK